jgi:hypothetical protein
MTVSALIQNVACCDPHFDVTDSFDLHTQTKRQRHGTRASQYLSEARQPYRAGGKMKGEIARL